MYESERLARTFFQRAVSGDQADSVAYLHPDARVLPSFDTSATLSRAELGEHFASGSKPLVLEGVAERYRPLDDNRVIVEGEVVVREADHGAITHRRVVWAMAFSDGLLYRGWAVTSVREAKILLKGLALPTEAEGMETRSAGFG